ncbi:hypothetical protein V5F34_17160 [Xanthobacter autotrophicus]|uniref:hypothetical protein n=1 Tax=Xanthobacter autotrophicus TaxID=280 RepID=UPI00372BF828
MQTDFMRPDRRRPGVLLAAITLCFAAVLTGPIPARADGSVSALGLGMGAPTPQRFAEFEAVVEKYNTSGERFVIDGHCQSACTMMLAIRNVCVKPSATLLFHAGGNPRTGKISADTTSRMLARYNPALRQYLLEKNAMSTFDFHPIPGSVIISRFGYPACK